MSELVLAAGAVAGVFTAVAAEKSTPRLASGQALERRIVSEAMRRVYDYERSGKITSLEKEKLLARYREQLAMLNAGDAGPNFEPVQTSTMPKEVLALVDRRMSEINAKLDDLANRIRGTEQKAVRPTASQSVERKESTAVKTENVQVESIESHEGDPNLDEIKSQIMQTLAKLEQAEVE